MLTRIKYQKEREQKKISADHTKLLRAVFDYKYDEAEAILKETPELVNVCEPLELYSPLLVAAEIPNEVLAISMIRLLLQYGADIHHRSRGNSTVLSQSCLHGGKDQVQVVINAGCDVTTDCARVPAIGMASERGNLELVKFLEEYGADVHCKFNLTTNAGVRCHTQAATTGQLHVLKYLITEKGLKVDDAENVLKLTPLYAASERGHLECVRFLLSCKADPNRRRTHGFTPMHIAAQNGHLEVLMLLAEAGGNINVTSDKGSTPLSLAKAKGQNHVVSYLGGDRCSIM